jgi:MFS family permease
MTQVHKIYLSNFLTGLVFWYGIEKLFLSSIGIDAVGVGIITVVCISLNLLLDIPSGMLADKWSRKGMLVVSAVAIGSCDMVLGSSNTLTTYLLGAMLYSLYVVSTSGTYQAITYDSLHELGQEKSYSKVQGSAYALFLCGAGVANIASGFVAARFGYRVPYYMSVIPSILNILVILSMVEPMFHKPKNKEKFLKQLGIASKTILSIRLLRTLTIITSAMGMIEIFKADFGQLYFLRYVTKPELLGILWAIYAFTWAIGGYVAHRFKNRLNLVVLLSTLPIIAMGFVDSWVGIILFNMQAVAGAVLSNQIETRIQDQTPSHLRASVVSVLSSSARLIEIPASLALGYIIKTHGAYVGAKYTSAVAAAILIFWLISNNTLSDNKAKKTKQNQ